MQEQLDYAPCGYVSFDDDGVIVAVNATLAGLLGHGPQALEGQHVERLLTIAGRIFYQTHFFPLLKLHGKAEEIFLTLRTKTGEDIPMLVNAVRRDGPGTPRSDCVLIPVHQRRKYEDEILAAKRQAEEALRTNAELVHARSEAEEQARELDRKVRQLERKNADLTRLSTILAHDMREPIRKMSVFASMLGQEDRERLSPMGGRAVDVIGAECARLVALVHGLYEYVSLDGSAFQVEPVDLSAVARAAARTVSARHGLSGLDVSLGPLPTVEGSVKQFELLLLHLLDNAVKFAGPGEAARVRISSREIQENSYRAGEGRYRYVESAQITVEDEGIGFEERYATYVFDALRKLDPATPGLGLGLALCKKVVENHGGTIKADPLKVRGLRITIVLPLKQ